MATPIVTPLNTQLLTLLGKALTTTNTVLLSLNASTDFSTPGSQRSFSQLLAGIAAFQYFVSAVLHFSAQKDVVKKGGMEVKMGWTKFVAGLVVPVEVGSFFKDAWEFLRELRGERNPTRLRFHIVSFFLNLTMLLKRALTLAILAITSRSAVQADAAPDARMASAVCSAVVTVVVADLSALLGKEKSRLAAELKGKWSVGKIGGWLGIGRRNGYEPVDAQVEMVWNGARAMDMDEKV